RRLRANGGVGMNRYGTLQGLACAAMVGLAPAIVAGPAVAGTIYRCESDGVTSYVSKRIRGASCSVATTYSPSRPSRPSTPSTTPGSASQVASAPSSAGAPATFMGGSATATPASAPAAKAPATPAAGSRRLVQGQVYSYVKDGVRHYTS